MVVKFRDDPAGSLGAGGAGRGRGRRRRARALLLRVGFFVGLLALLFRVRIRVVLAVAAVVPCETCDGITIKDKALRRRRWNGRAGTCVSVARVVVVLRHALAPVAMRARCNTRRQCVTSVQQPFLSR